MNSFLIVYCENPIKIMDKIETIDNIYKNKNKEQIRKKVKDIQDIQELEYDKNYDKDEDKKRDKNIENDLLSKSNSQASGKNIKIYNTLGTTTKTNFTKNLKTTITEMDKINNTNNNADKNEFSSISVSNINQNVTSLNKKIKFIQFYKITTSEFVILFLSFLLYFIYSIIMLILVIYGINRLYYLISYINYNDLIDGYLYDNTNAIIYIINTNTTSNYYGGLIDGNTDKDYINDNIDLLYESILNKDDIEQFRESKFIPVDKIFNVNCTAGIIPDESLRNIVGRFNINYDAYFGELCKEFPVASTGIPSSIYFEIIYLVSHIYRKYEKSESFYLLFQNNLNKTELYQLFTITLTFFRMERNYFYNNIIMVEINQIIYYFSQLILMYLVISIIFEVVIFLLLYCGMIRQVKKKDSLFGNFIDSFKYD